MAENVVYLHRRPEPIGHFLRVGSTGHRQLEDLLGSGRMMLNRVVVDASAVGRQHDLLASLADSGAELSSIGRFNGTAKSAPWANPKSVGDDGLSEVLTRSSERLDRMHAVLDSLKATMADAPRSLAPKRRIRPSSAAASGKG